MKKIILMSLVALMTITMTSCMGCDFAKPLVNVLIDGGSKDETPTQVTEINQPTTMESFNVVKMNGAFKVIYEQGTEYSVRVEASEEAFKEITVYVKDNELCISETTYQPSSKLDEVKIFVSSPELNTIDLIGSGSFAAENAINLGSDPRVFVMGAGNISLKSVTCDGRSIFDVMESGNIVVGDLKANEAIVSTGDSGNINFGTLECKFMFASVSGSGNINCDNITADKVETSISGSGNVNLKGTVKEVNKEITGSGKLNINGAAATDTVK